MADPLAAPIGSIVAWAGPPNTIPANWRVCNGESLDRTKAANKALFDAIGTGWGGDGAKLFSLPDLQGLFLRGVAGDSGRDPEAKTRVSAAPDATNPGNKGNAVGSMQPDALQSHKHASSVKRVNICGSNNTHDVAQGTQKYNADPKQGSIDMTVGDASDGGSGPPRTAPETRPKNAYVFWIIRWQ